MISILRTKAEFISKAVEIFLTSYNEIILNRNQFHFVIAGGETPIPVYKEIIKIPITWSNFSFWFSDERCYPKSHPELNSEKVGSIFINELPIDKNQIHLINSSAGPEKAAGEYSDKLKEISTFDLVFLGIGEDGHTASLFPNMEIGEFENSPDAIPIYNAPKSPANRVSISFNKLKKSKKVVFLASGSSKEEIIKTIHLGTNPASKLYNELPNADILFYRE
ncbi:6-phosphogluconolactonase [Leptospira kanakyensis]|uniref:6-phosphogluconolactonase n=1 Tax=Leptospira kanakyensis TaxID=2484968 RepID=UPI00223CA106|nr:6-phosphogluconolactonase [Leptospira kanakyensis]MCW7482133.1 6-phosphogluconolactonase [Leptospira kanakyensis]